jgi:5-formyltetrahydrofolate cyclo-ligase
MTQDEEKSQLRKQIRALLKEQSALLREARAKEIALLLMRDPIYQKAACLMFYVSTDEEVNTRFLIQQALRDKKKVMVPRLSENNNSIEAVEISSFEDDLVAGAHGILEPKQDLQHTIDLSDLALILVPGLAFDRKRHRLGRGKGCYDRFLAASAGSVKRYGLAFNFQVCERLPVNPMDVSMDKVFTEAGIFG